MPDTPTLQTVRAVAKALNVSPFLLYRKVQAGQLPAYRLGRKVLLDVAEVIEAMRRPVQREV